MTRAAIGAKAGQFIKRYPSVLAADTALHRAGEARAAMVATPAVLGRFGPKSLVFERVVTAASPLPGQMLAALRPLHRMPSVGLTRFDPFRRILPRLGVAPPRIGALVMDLQTQDSALHWTFLGAIHGDFHPGQVLCDAEGKVWLVDLDDLAIAPPEADFGNLAAWMATQAEGPLVMQAKAALSEVLALVPDTNPYNAWHFCQISLVRRALKLAQKGQPWALRQLPLRA